MHVSAQGLHILGNEDSVLPGLVPEGIKAVCKGDNGPLGQVCDWMGLPLRSAVGVLSEWMIAQRLPGDRLGGQTEPNTLEAHPRPRAHCPSRTLPQVVVHPVCHA